ncbi:lysozyme family protein [Gottfriedia sp. NPDC057948]|uniref:bifunctional lytic transglycosylase/C40 family peptidase n=1 Tax=Gottfriedia sp. NPDC057948 TaxID=3346287 RepID=UPI0036DA0C36
MSGEGAGGTAQVSAEVLRYEPLIRKYAEEYGIGEYVGLIMALIQQESGGRQLDVMQSSESIGLPPGGITDPDYSIKIGVKYFSEVMKQAKGDIRLALQAYNFGNSFIQYALERGGYSEEVASQFSQIMSEKLGWSSYGDVNYVEHVLRYYNTENGSIVVVGDGTQRFDVEEVHNIMKKFLGFPYVWGGRTPASGGFDCSGLLEYAFAQVGINLYGTAESQYNKTIPVPENQIKPGDLVFFSTYKSGPSHVGMYVGDGKFINANGSNGTSYSSVEEWKKLYPFLGFRRIP